MHCVQLSIVFPVTDWAMIAGVPLKFSHHDKGKPEYYHVAPEQFNTNPPQPLSLQTDVYAAGWMLYQLLYHGAIQDATCDNLYHNAPRNPGLSQFPNNADLEALMRDPTLQAFKCLFQSRCENPNLRPDLHHLIRAFQQL